MNKTHISYVWSLLVTTNVSRLSCFRVLGRNVVWFCGQSHSDHIVAQSQTHQTNMPLPLSTSAKVLMRELQSVNDDPIEGFRYVNKRILRILEGFSHFGILEYSMWTTRIYSIGRLQFSARQGRATRGDTSKLISDFQGTIPFRRRLFDF